MFFLAVLIVMSEFQMNGESGEKEFLKEENEKRQRKKKKKKAQQKCNPILLSSH